MFLSRILSTLGLLQYYERGKTLLRIPDAAELWWVDVICKLINFVCIVLNVFRFCKLGYISVSTINLLGPGQHIVI